MADAKLPYKDPAVEDRSLASQTIPRAGGIGGVANREEVVIGNATANAALAEVLNTNPAGTEYGLVTRNIPSGVQSMSGNVAITVGSVGISSFPQGVLDVFGAVRVASQNSQIDVQFYRDTPQNLVTVTTANGGTATSSLGGALFQTSATANGTATGTTLSRVTYHGGAEIYAYFTALFNAGGNPNCFMRIGLYDANDGAYIGFESTTFSVSYRNNAVDTHISVFNGDPLDGSAASKFTRNGIAEVWDKTKFNVYRIRCGWVGGAPFIYEVLSPDDKWITIHTVQFPNSATAPSIRNMDLPVQLEVTKTGSAGVNLSILTGCWAAGNTYIVADQNTVGAGAQTALNQNVTLDIAGTGSYDCYQFHSVGLEIVPAAGTVTTGVISFEGSNDNVNFVAVPLFDLNASDLAPVTSYSVAAATTRYWGGPINLRYFRARISTGITGTTTGVQCFSRWRVASFDRASIVVDTELPAASSLSDGMGAQTVPGIAAYNMFFDGSGYDRVSITKPMPTRDTPLATYMTSFSSVAAGQGHCVEVIGSATKTVKVWEVFIEKPTAAATFTLVKQSAVDTGGSSANQTIVPVDHLDGAATAVVKAYTATPTAGTLVGSVWNTIVATTEREDILFGSGNVRPVTLRGATQSLAINTTVAGTNNFTIVLTEETPST